MLASLAPKLHFKLRVTYCESSARKGLRKQDGREMLLKQYIVTKLLKATQLR